MDKDIILCRPNNIFSLVKYNFFNVLFPIKKYFATLFFDSNFGGFYQLKYNLLKTLMVALAPLLPFTIGGFSGMFATLCVQPLDTLKVQIQVISEQYGKINQKKRISIINVLQKIYQQKGFSILYRGLDSALLRQLFYTSARLGSYQSSIKYLQSKGRTVSLVEKSLLSVVCGVFGALIGNPFDVALVRRQASISTGLNPYANTYDAFKSIIRDEGVLGLWTGIRITILRVLLINFGQLAVTDIIKHNLKPIIGEYRFVLDNSSAFLASFITSLISLPADNIKTKLQKDDAKNREYKGIVNCFNKTVQREGFSRLWVGFPIYLIRGMPHSFILIRTQQFLTDMFNINKY